MTGLSWFGVDVMPACRPDAAARPSRSRIAPRRRRANCSLNFAKSPKAERIACAERAGWLAAALRGVEPQPEQRVIPVTTAIVADGRAHGFGGLGEPGQQLIE